ncbi:glycosyltransferase family 2 protein [Bowmanella sp. Y26]|uniref:glycosyltransferase family 2 protein n=1 Tax=Bowmanella yangjiangensis TaxID=2811230 RepID=UPI001BDD48B8|nr:glycosyltransferase family 2 protein [Bowmanella yangjiangensis]MBT1064915.1 glycosyltransferase family 2 protein [Bowmanella yangjiangensis]
MNKTLKVKLVAVAKDEAAYLPEWIHHHLYVGFDAIDIYLNRTSDNSAEVLQRIQQQHPNVNFFYADWIDYCPPEVSKHIQYLTYAKSFQDCRDSGEFDYMMFLDIDEFWMPKDLSFKVQNCLEENADADCISFQWLNEEGSSKSFSALNQNIRGRLSPLVKSLFRVNANVAQVSLHVPRLKKGKSVLCDGKKFKQMEKKRECLHESLHQLRDIMIVHRLFRSEREYLSLLNRGRPSDEVPLKLNREGYNFAGDPSEDVTFSIKPGAFRVYHESLQRFMSSSNLDDVIAEARQFVENRYKMTLRDICRVPKEYFVEMVRVIRGLTLKSVFKDIRLTIDTYFAVNRCNSSGELIALAKEVERVDLRLALEVWKKALELRPNGPMIKARIAEYESIELKPGMKRSDLRKYHN